MHNHPKKPATIEDVARLAEVSIATVSRAISKPEKVAESTRKKVNAAIARTGYTANAMAQNLRRQRSHMVLVLAESISDPNFPGILTGLEKVANARGYGVLIGNTDGDVALEEKYLRFLSAGTADGLILLTGHLPVAGWPEQSKSLIPPAVAAATPVQHDNISYVCTDDRAAARIATEYLMSLGHKRIVYVAGPKGNVLSERRLQGYCDALSQSSEPMSIWKIDGDGTSLGGRAAVERLFIRDTLPTAFFCFNDNTAIGVIGALQDRGYDVPGDMSVVGFDDIPFASNITPALTTIRQPRSQIGEHAMTALLDRLAQPNAPTEGKELHGDLIVRSSCSAPKT
ncbi:LacI family repressor for deo operon, udp, cdd, tsx, nupC, and nupG [Yoonia maritima]|uniref:LacI family repressor for deo operon, udp, cdd, tsx, nupC, and nupG n=1 Tax=Yoonia maritima TaxID=1435347 RepID=A0A2T0VX16_9RHOB|nr:LacI family DNA-binding transcriptional regulator [Yoonia maritima]PRY76379.1 LacI family repressor for deo operon, udp, cdd, tsx, nupC, and nupG [Yoonia maritima]